MNILLVKQAVEFLVLDEIGCFLSNSPNLQLLYVECLRLKSTFNMVESAIFYFPIWGWEVVNFRMRFFLGQRNEA